MSNDIFELNIFTEFDIDNNSFNEFTSHIESLDMLLSTDLLFNEAAVGQSQGIIRGVKNAANRAGKGTKDALEVYNNITDAGGAIIDTIYQLTVNSMNLITKILKFIIVNLVKIPLALAKMIKYLTKIPEKIYNKVNKNIELYITIDDMPLLQTDIIKYLKDFMTLATSFTTEGDYSKGLFIFNGNDFVTYNKMNNIYNKISKIKFEKTVIHVNNKQVVETYLSPKSVYYTGINNVLNSLKADKPKFEELAKMAETKFDANKIKGTVSKLSPEDQLKAKNSIQMISTVVSIIGNLVKYIISDISTIDKTLKQLEKSDKHNLLEPTSDKKDKK
jgi:hypothetical protein